MCQFATLDHESNWAKHFDIALAQKLMSEPFMPLKPRLPRFACHARIAAAGVPAKLIRGEVRDISTTGLCLVTPLTLAKGTTLHLSFRLPTGLIEAVGEVRWVTRHIGQPNELGIRFVRIEASAQYAIMAAIDGEPAVAMA